MAEAAAPAPPPPVRRSSLGRVLWVLALLALGLLIAVPVAVVGSLRTEAGTRWWLGQVPGLQVDQPRGSLLGGDFAAERLHWLLPGPGDVLVLEQPAWQGLALSRSADPGTWLAVRVERLQARSARYTPAARPAAPNTPLVAPASLRLPVALHIEALALGEFHTPALGAQPLRELAGRLELGADGGARHRLDGLRLRWDRLAASGSLQVDSDAPMALRAQVQLGPADAAAPPGAAASAPGAWRSIEAWRAELQADGPLAQPRLRVQARRDGDPGAPLLDATAGLRPFAAWPLADLQARTQGLDLSAFASAAPRTALNGEATVRATGLDQPASADIRLDNTAAGPWNEARLPLRRLQLRLQARPDQPQVATIEQFDAELGSAARPAGRLTGRGGIDHGRWQVEATLDRVAPERLDARATPMLLSGSLRADGQPLVAGADALGAAAPRPGASGARAAVPGTAGAVSPGAGASGPPTAPRPVTPNAPAPPTPANGQQVHLRAALSGQLTTADPAPTRARSDRATASARSDRATASARSDRATASARSDRATASARSDRAAASARSVRAAAPVRSGRVTAPTQNARVTTPPRPAASPGASPELRLDLDATAQLGAAGRLALDLKQAELRAGAARAAFIGNIDRPGEAEPWAVKGRASLADFDPRPWWAGAEGSAWRRGPHRLTAEAQLDLRWAPSPAPAAAPSATTPPRREPAPHTAAGRADPTADALAAIAPLRGQITLQLRPSLLAGVPLEGRLELRATGPEAGVPELDATLALTAAGNRASAQVKTRADRPAADRWAAQIDAPALAALAPAAAMLGLLPEAAAPASPRSTDARAAAARPAPAGGLAGRLTAEATWTGRWPAVQTEGRLAADGLRAAGLSLQRGTLRWQLGTLAEAPAELQGELSRLAVAGQTADTVTLQLAGNARNHRLTVAVDSQAAAAPPAALSRPAARAAATAGTGTGTGTGTRTGPASASATATNGNSNGNSNSNSNGTAPASGPTPWRIDLRAEGGLQFPGGSALAATGWRGRVLALDARSGGGPGPAPARAVALGTRDVALDLAWPDGQPARLAAQPGRLDLQAGPTQAALRWSRLAWQAAAPGRAMQLDAEAELEPLAVAPLLARLQPDFGWGGDLELGGKLSVQTSPALRADIVLERRRGDLSVTDEVGTQALGLSDLRLALNADQGVWSFTQALAGSTVGVAAGAVVARTGSADAWPTAATPIQGVLELRVANLGAWGPWVPAGWRLGGALRISAGIGGRLGAPEYTGEVRGNGLAVRNFAEGVNVTDGEVAVQLQGSTARIETFTAQAGGGTVALSGDASFGSAPKATLALRAQQFQLLGRVDRRIVASGDSRLTLEADRIALDGRFQVDEGLIDFTRGDAPTLSDDVTVVRPGKGSPAADTSAQGLDEQKAGAAASRLGSEADAARRSGSGPAATRPAPNRRVALNLAVNLGERLRLRGRGLDTGLRGELRITSPGGRLAVNGSVSAQGGTYLAYGQRLVIDRGAIVFSGAVDNPRLDIEATRPNTDVRVGVTVAGTATNPRVRLFSEPELPEVDKLSWLVLGRASDGLGRTETALLQRAAMALLAGEGEGRSDRLTRAIGLDDISLRQTDGEVRETVITLGKQLSRRWYVGYERGLNTTSGSWQLIYRIAQRLTLRAQSGLENSVDMIWTWRWR